MLGGETIPVLGSGPTWWTAVFFRKDTGDFGVLIDGFVSDGVVIRLVAVLHRSARSLNSVNSIVLESTVNKCVFTSDRTRTCNPWMKLCTSFRGVKTFRQRYVAASKCLAY